MNSNQLHKAKAWLLKAGVLESYQYAPGPAVSMPKHSHDEYQMCLTLGGSDAEFSYRGAYYQVPVNSLSILHPGEIHQVRQLEDCQDNTSQWILYLNPDQLHKVALALKGRYNTLPFFSKILILDPKLIHLYLQFCDSVKRVASSLEQDTLLVSLLGELIQRYTNVRAEQPLIWKNHQPVQKARLYLDEHFAENVTLERLAEIAYLSPYHLNRIFSQTVGLPPHKYKIQRQVKQARSLLLQGMPLKQVAAETGFADQSHLTRQFKRLMQVTPGQYQPQNRKNVQD